LLVTLQNRVITVLKKRGGGRKTILNNSPHESKAVNESFESSRIE